MPIKHASTKANARNAGLHTVLALCLGSAASLLIPPATAGERDHSMNTNKTLVTMRGKPVVLLGTIVDVRDQAPDFRVVDADGLLTHSEGWNEQHGSRIEQCMETRNV